MYCLARKLHFGAKQVGCGMAKDKKIVVFPKNIFGKSKTPGAWLRTEENDTEKK